MEKPSAGSGILSRSRAKTAPNGGQPHSEDDSSEEEHSHGEPGGLGLKARWSGEGSWKVEEGGGRVANHRWFLPLLDCNLSLLVPGVAGTGNLQAGPLTTHLPFALSR
jgi:hypothetical protein